MALLDLDEMIFKCRNENGKKHISEAIASYRAGAYRSSIVMTWIAVVFDLLDKIRDLALAGDAEAQKIVADLDNKLPLVQKGDVPAIKWSLDLERQIVQITSDKFGFFDGTQSVELERIQADRNRCAHPTYVGIETPYAPSAELARTHLAHAVEYALSQPPVQGKAATATILKTVSSKYFPLDPEKAKQQLLKAGMERPKDSLVRSVLDQLTLAFFEDPALQGEQRIAVALNVIHDLFPGEAETRLRKMLNAICARLLDSDLPLFFDFQRSFRSSWTMLDDPSRDKLRLVVRDLSDEKAVSVLPIALTISDLDDVTRARMERLEILEFAKLIEMEPNPKVVEEAVRRYSTSPSYNAANVRYNYLIQPLLAHLSKTQIRRILKAHKDERADLNGANSFYAFTGFVYEKELIPKADVISILTQQDMQSTVTRLLADAVEDKDVF